MGTCPALAEAHSSPPLLQPAITKEFSHGAGANFARGSDIYLKPSPGMLQLAQHQPALRQPHVATSTPKQPLLPRSTRPQPEGLRIRQAGLESPRFGLPSNPHCWPFRVLLLGLFLFHKASQHYFLFFKDCKSPWSGFLQARPCYTPPVKTKLMPQLGAGSTKKAPRTSIQHPKHSSTQKYYFD